MQPIAADVAYSMVCVSFVSTQVSCAETAVGLDLPRSKEPLLDTNHTIQVCDNKNKYPK